MTTTTVDVDFSNTNVFVQKPLPPNRMMLLEFTPVIQPAVLAWLEENVGRQASLITTTDEIATWQGIKITGVHRPGDNQPIKTYVKGYRFRFASKDKALLFKLTCV